MKLENRNSANIQKGAAVKNYLDRKDAQIKSMRSTTAGVAEGVLVFPKKKEDWEIAVLTWTGRDGNVRDYPAVICNDSEGTEHAIALSAFRAKDEIITNDGTINCTNLCEFDADYQTIWNTLQSAKEITLHRVVGRRNNRKGRYEFFTMN
ncbi:MAG: hypothetical protein J5965_12655 [Aeriscardovia sp.]|nr:hypothetical protein [Aeriscardovia sp.]MBP3840312.1 hypothetical protein [Chryseobacterium sp.]